MYLDNDPYYITKLKFSDFYFLIKTRARLYNLNVLSMFDCTSTWNFGTLKHSLGDLKFISTDRYIF